MSSRVAVPAGDGRLPNVAERVAPRWAALTVVLAGNPNAGKTTLFNALTGLRQKVANYPGVTVERKEGVWPLGPDAELAARLVDLPGLYSLDATSIDEQIARDVISGRSPVVPLPDAIVAVVDATNVERNLYLLTQILEMGRPVVVALTMMDLADKRGYRIDVDGLARELGVPVVAVSAAKGRNLTNLAEAVAEAARSGGSPEPAWRLSEAAEREVESLARATSVDRRTATRELYAVGEDVEPARRALVEATRARLAAANENWWQEPLLARYRWIERVADGTVHAGAHRAGISERIDHVLTHKVFGPIALVLVLLVVFQTIFSWASVPMDLIDSGFGSLGEWIRGAMPPGLLTDLLVDGVVKGVGGVLVFLPQILLLFFFIALLEDSGYMARAAFLMDRLMRSVGLHGKAFLPLMSSFACAIPGIMATRTIESPKDRLATILIAPFMSCSARLPVYTLMIAAFFSGEKVFGFVSLGAVVILSMYMLGIAVAVVVAWILKHTILKSPPPPFVMELPAYRMPNFSNIFHTMLTRSWLFVRRAGTVILAISILLWVLVTFPRTAPAEAPAATVAATDGAPAGAQDETAVRDEESAEQLRNSFAGRLGRFIEPAIRPLGFDWQMGIGIIASFAAREVLVSTLSITYGVGADADAESTSLVDAVRDAKRPDGRPAWTPLVAVSMMVFFVLACQCISTVAVVRRETNSWRWPLFMVAYMTVLAYVASLLTYQGGLLLGFS